MSKPTLKQVQEVFTALVTNGFDFFVYSAHELPKDQKLSVGHFATGVELLLKAVLFHEHWTLILNEPHSCAWSGVEDGTFRTIRASDLCAAIASTTGTPLNRERMAFESVFTHRNRIFHWGPDGDLAATAVEQCLAWHHLQALLTVPWRHSFAPFRSRIDEVGKLLRQHRRYLQACFEQHEKALAFLEESGRLLSCTFCGFRSGVAAEAPERVVPFDCLVCGYASSAARVGCDALYSLDDLPVEDCECGEKHDRAELVEALDQSDCEVEASRGHCGACLDLDDTVVPDGGSQVCVCCGARFGFEQKAIRCDRCNERWFGCDTEGSYLSGCSLCGGLSMDDG